MTVSAQTTFNTYTGNGVTTVFPYQFKILAGSDLQVYVAGALKALGVDYTVSGVGVDTGGNVTFITSAPAAAAVVSIIRAMSAARSTDYQLQGDFNTATVNPDFDKPILLIQDLQTQLGRSIRMPVDEVGTLPTLPSIAARTSKFIAFDAFGQPIASAGTGGGDSALRTDLASTLSGSAGAQLSGHRRTEAGSVARSVASALAALSGVNLADFVTDFTGATDQTTGINAAITAAMSAISKSNTIVHPGGNIRHDSQILAPGGLTVLGFSRAACQFSFGGTPGTSPANTRSAWRYNSGAVNSSGYANVTFERVRLHYTNSVNFSANLELSAGGFSYFNIINCWISGFASYGLILDATELCFVHDCLIENNSGIATGANILITNGATRSAGQGIGYSNVISIRDNQLSGNGAYGLLDEGGNNLVVDGNNFNEHRFPVAVSGRTSLRLGINSYETHKATGSAAVLFSNLDLAGNNVGPCFGFEVKGGGFYADLSAGGSELVFFSQTYAVTAVTKAASAVFTINTVSATNPFFVGCPVTAKSLGGMVEMNDQTGIVSAIGGVSGAWTFTLPINSTAFTNYTAGGNVACFHMAGDIKANNFGAQVNRTAAIDVTYLANSEVGSNFDYGNASMTHYTGVHIDALGNDLKPPQNGALVALGINGPNQTDTRFRHIVNSGFQYATPKVIPYSAAMAFDMKDGNAFEITPTNGVGFTLNSPSNATGGNKYRVWIINTTGGALGAITLGGSFRTTGAITQPATGFRRWIEFEVNVGGLSYETNRSLLDLAN